MVKNNKVCYASGYKRTDVPFIKVSGEWLRELGFAVDDQIQLFGGDEMIVIVKADKEAIKIMEAEEDQRTINKLRRQLQELEN